MKILLAHNFYRNRGGEDTVFWNERSLLMRYGHEVIVYERSNESIALTDLTQLVTLPLKAVWNWESYAAVKELILQHKPDVAHFHNTLPLISPAAYRACWDNGVPVVQSLHNSRLICPAGGLFRDGKYCEDCLHDSFPWSGVLHGCYRKSRLQTAIIGVMTAFHREIGTWDKAITRYVAFSQFFRDKFIEAGFSEEKIMIKPHFVDDPGNRNDDRNYVLYVGRLMSEKGIETLLRAWQMLPGIPLKICGGGGKEALVQQCVEKSNGQIEWIPTAPHEKVIELMQSARFLVWPSEFAETFGMVALEALACGVPVISSGLGAMPDLVIEGVTGLNFAAGMPNELARVAQWAWDHEEQVDEMGLRGRAMFQSKFSAEHNYEALIKIYQEAIRVSASRTQTEN